MTLTLPPNLSCDQSRGRLTPLHFVHAILPFEDEKKEQFKMLMRMAENFSGCQVLSYCVMSKYDKTYLVLGGES